MRIDGRTLSHEVSEHIRMMAVRRVLDGEKPSAVIKSYGLARTMIYYWLNIRKKNGEEGLKAKKHPGPDCKLTVRQKKQVVRWINGKDPRQYGFDFGLWTRKIVATMIAERFKTSMGLTAVGRLLAQLGITPQKPLRRAYERDPDAILKWKEKDYPRLKARAKRVRAKIFFLDEAGVRSDQVLGKTWGLKGQTPEVPTSGKRQSINAISAVNLQGAFWWKTYSGRFNGTLFLALLKSFMKNRGKTFLVLDGHPVHGAKMIKKYIESLKGRLELHFLPGYAPELNPDEFVWNYLKNEGVSKKPLKKMESLKSRVTEDLASIKKRPPLVRSFFYAPSVRYTAD
jgi:transposase